MAKEQSGTAVQSAQDKAAALDVLQIKTRSEKQDKRVEAHMDEDQDCIVFSINKADLLKLVGPSSTGKGSGAVVNFGGDFTFTHNGKEIPFSLNTGWRGCWMTVYRKES